MVPWDAGVHGQCTPRASLVLARLFGSLIESAPSFATFSPPPPPPWGSLLFSISFPPRFPHPAFILLLCIFFSLPPATSSSIFCFCLSSSVYGFCCTCLSAGGDRGCSGSRTIIRDDRSRRPLAKIQSPVNLIVRDGPTPSPMIKCRRVR